VFHNIPSSAGPWRPSNLAATMRAVAESQKPAVIELLFDERWDSQSKQLSRPVVTLADVQRAIHSYNAAHPATPLSARNPANFFKDFIRNKRNANTNWPARVWQSGFTAKQVTGENRCFEFVPLVEGQDEPFPLNRVPAPSEATPRHSLESASLPLASRRLGRADETWLTQVAVRLRLIETHLALFSSRHVVQVDHLQMSIKRSPAEIDALYLVHETVGEVTQEAIATVEAKGMRDDILEDQVLAQIRTAFAMPEVEQETVIPMAMKTVGPSEVHVVEFEAVMRGEESDLSELVVASEAVYTLRPAVPGIGVAARPRRRRESG
jgi:hypothetical protein